MTAITTNNLLQERGEEMARLNNNTEEVRDLYFKLGRDYAFVTDELIDCKRALIDEEKRIKMAESLSPTATERVVKTSDEYFEVKKREDVLNAISKMMQSLKVKIE